MDPLGLSLELAHKITMMLANLLTFALFGCNRPARMPIHLQLQSCQQRDVRLRSCSHNLGTQGYISCTQQSNLQASRCLTRFQCRQPRCPAALQALSRGLAPRHTQARRGGLPKSQTGQPSLMQLSIKPRLTGWQPAANGKRRPSTAWVRASGMHGHICARAQQPWVRSQKTRTWRENAVLPPLQTPLA